MKIESIYRHFMVTPVSHLPVVDQNFNLVGLVSKEKLLIEMSDISGAGTELEKISDDFLDYNITESIIQYFQNNRTIPVLNLTAQKVDSWEKPRFLAEITKLTDKSVKEEEVVKKEDAEFSDNKNVIFQYMSLILSSFPDSLFATDKEGVTTFYNEQFEKDVLGRGVFHDSIQLAERYIKELNQNLFSNYLKTHELNLEAQKGTIPVIQAYLKDLNLILRIITLQKEGKVSGFLYHFIEPKSRIQLMNEEGVSLPSIEEAMQMNLPLQTVLDEVESYYIFHKLKRNEDNVSHAAEELGIPRSTLQNKMKLLNINERFNRDSSTPIPRKRKKSVENIKGSDRSVLKLEKEPVKVSSEKKVKADTKKPKPVFTAKKTSRQKLKTAKPKSKRKVAPKKR